MQVDCMVTSGTRVQARPDLAVPSARVSDEEMFQTVFLSRPVFKDGGSRVEFRILVEARRWVGQSGESGCGCGKCDVGAAAGVRSVEKS